MERKLSFRVAREPEVLEQVHRLNYATFVEEIPQHAPNPERRLVDRFHEENTYLVCLDGEALAGMAAVRDQRPFSLDGKVEDLDALMPPERPVCEVRLWAVAPRYRDATVMLGLRDQLWEYCTGQGYAVAVISGTTRQARLYSHLGFVPFGPPVGTESAPYQPMFFRFADHDLGSP